MSEHYEPWRHTRQKRSRDEPFHTVRRSNPHRNGCTHSAPPSTHRHAHRPASSAEQDSSEINERPPPSTGKPNRRFVFCKNGAEASLLEARHSNGRHSAQFEMHCLRFCVFSACTRTQCAYGPRTARWHRSRRSNRCRSGTSLEPRRTLCSHPSRSGRAHCTPGGSCWGSAPAVQDEKQKAA